MNKSFFKYMNDSDNCVYDFVNACEKMADSNFIIAEGKISAVLKSIASSSKLYTLFFECAAGFDFDKTFEASKVDYSEKKSILRLPKDKRHFVCFVLYLLLKFDERLIDFHEFLNSFYFVGENLQDSYQKFCDEVVRPFSKTVFALYSEIIGAPDISQSAVENVFEKDREESFVLNTSDIQMLLEEIAIMQQQVGEMSNLNSAEKKEIILMADGLANAIKIKNESLIKIMWVGYKNTLVKQNLLSRAARVEKALNMMQLL